jgi:DNA-binding NarL/FixJ family response regulator
MLPPNPLSPASIRPLIVDSHDATRLGLAVLLQRQAWVATCLLAATSGEARELVKRHRPEVALLDISNDGPFVASAVARVRDPHTAMAVVLISRCSATLPKPSIELGSTAFIPPGATSKQIVAAVDAAVVSPARSTRALTTDAPDPMLTERERQLLTLISTGATNREIAGHLHLRPDAVKKNASALYRKLGVRNRTEAARLASQVLGR